MFSTPYKNVKSKVVKPFTQHVWRLFCIRPLLESGSTTSLDVAGHHFGAVLFSVMMESGL